MTTVKSKIIEQKYTYPSDKWAEKIAKYQADDKKNDSSKYTYVITEACKELIKEKFDELVEKKVEMENELGSFIYFDIVVDENNTNLNKCEYKIVFEVFTTKECEKIDVVQEGFFPMLNPLVDSKLDTYAKRFGYKDASGLKESELKGIKKWYKQQVYSQFYDMLVDDSLAFFDVQVSDYALENWERVSQDSSYDEIKKLAFTTKVKSEIGHITDWDVKVMLRHAPTKLVADGVEYKDEDEKKEALRQWITKTIYGKKILAKYFSDLFRSIVAWR